MTTHPSSPSMKSETYGGCTHVTPSIVEARWAKFNTMPARSDVGICEHCGGPALIKGYTEFVIAFLNENDEQESQVLEFAKKVLCTRCDDA